MARVPSRAVPEVSSLVRGACVVLTFSSSLTLREVSVMRILCIGASVPSKPVATFLIADMMRLDRGERQSERGAHRNEKAVHPYPCAWWRLLPAAAAAAGGWNAAKARPVAHRATMPAHPPRCGTSLGECVVCRD